MYVAVMDIGSNSSRLDLFELDQSGQYRHMLFGRVSTRLVGYVDADNAVSEKGVALAADSLKQLSAQALAEHAVDEWHVFATASLRGRSNESRAVAAIKEKTGFDVDVIAGIEEAKLGYASLRHRYSPRCAVMADVGGGSTEIVVADGGEVVSVESLPLGSRALSDRFVAGAWPDAAEAASMSNEIEGKLARFRTMHLSEQPVLFGIGGTARALQAIFQSDRAGFSAGLRMQVERSCPERLDTMAAGTLIFEGLWNVFDPSRFVASDANPREGYLIEHVAS